MNLSRSVRRPYAMEAAAHVDFATAVVKVRQEIMAAIISSNTEAYP